MTPLFINAEKAAKAAGPSKKTLPELLDEIRQDEKLSNAAHWEDGNKIRDGIMKRAPDEGKKMLSMLSRVDLNLHSAQIHLAMDRQRKRPRKENRGNGQQCNLLHSRSTASPQSGQIRFLLYALRQLIYFLVHIQSTTLAINPEQDPPPRMERQNRPHHVRVPSQPSPPPRRNQRLRTQGSGTRRG